MMNERRKFLRFETALNALCEIVAAKSKSASRVKNISKEGALLMLSQALSQGAEINLSMDVPGDNVPIYASCQVAWQKEGADKSGNLYETGVKFTKIDNTDKGRLIDYLYSRWLKLVNKT